jgi:ribosomal protein L11 methyltransferase
VTTASFPDPQRSYPSLLLNGTTEAIDAVIGELFEEGCLGTETIDGATRQRAYFPRGTNLNALADKLACGFPKLRIGPIEMLAEQDWVALSRKDMSGYALGERFFVCPSWETPPDAAETSRMVLRIDPQQAFGTGRHDTTRLCVELLERYAGSEIAAIDVGTGTGILAMAAAALGCRPVVAIEIDPDAAACARENVKRNRLDTRVEVVSADLENAAPAPAGLLVANLHRPLLDREMSRLSDWLEPEGHMILSGITVEDVEELVSMLEGLPHPMRLVRYHTAGEWAALLAKSPAEPGR